MRGWFLSCNFQALGEDLITVLDQLRIKYCIGIGDGAGANVMLRFGMMHVTRYAIWKKRMKYFFSLNVNRYLNDFTYN